MKFQITLVERQSNFSHVTRTFKLPSFVSLGISEFCSFCVLYVYERIAGSEISLNVAKQTRRKMKYLIEFCRLNLIKRPNVNFSGICTSSISYTRRTKFSFWAIGLKYVQSTVEQHRSRQHGFSCTRMFFSVNITRVSEKTYVLCM